MTLLVENVLRNPYIWGMVRHCADQTPVVDCSERAGRPTRLDFQLALQHKQGARQQQT